MNTEKGTITKTITTSDKAGSVVDVGVVNLCGGPQPGTNSFIINGDGFSNALKVINLQPYPQSTSIYTVSEAVTYLSVFDVSDTLRFTIFFRGKSTGRIVTDQNSGVFIQRISGGKTVTYTAGIGFQGTSAEINITRYDAVGGLVEGTFQGTFMSDTQKPVTITNGKFSVIRYSDI
jgi:hypothetical protein